MQKTSKINQIAIDKTTITCYNTIMTNDNNNTKNQFLKGTTDMTNVAHDVRVIKCIGTSYDTFANFPTVQDALDYMRRMDFGIDTWYIVNADGVRLRLNDQDKLVVFNSLIG
jgi:ABC-type transport system substrate-binding protein